MEIVLAKTAGFCFGVKRAVDMVYEQAGKGNVYTFGPIIHNEEVVKDLEKKGVTVLHSLKELEEVEEGTIVIRSHGVSEAIYQLLKEKKLQILDATCPFVRKIHRIVREQSEAGRDIIITGDEKHPEVEGIRGWCHGRVTVLENAQEAENYQFSEGKGVCVVSQTTFTNKKFKDIVEILSKKSYDILAMNTICNATEERQSEAASLAKDSDAMLVIGGKQSSNTQKLYDICKRECKNTYYIQTLVDLDLEKFKSFRSVGITAGASTPNNIIEEVLSYVRNE